jgi:hypothetical protein
MAAADPETAAAPWAEVATLRMRVQVWNPSRTCDFCLLCLRLIAVISSVRFSPPKLWVGCG